MDRYAIIVAGGSGTRMNSVVPKQFLKLSGKPVLIYSLLAFRSCYPSLKIFLVLPENYIDYWNSLCLENELTISHQVIPGGEKRYHSVRNALEKLPSEGFVAIHDGVRPLITTHLISRAFEAAGQYGNAVPVTEVNDSVRILDKNSNRPMNRQSLRLIQTPQVFDLAPIKNAYLQKFDERFTDDASVLESAGKKIHLIDGDPYNFKITFPEDIFLAESLLKQRRK